MKKLFSTLLALCFLFTSSMGLSASADQESSKLNSPVTRGSFLVSLYEMAGSPESAHEWPFSDLEAGSPYGDAVGWAVCYEVVSGYPDGTIRVDSSLTREQAVVILYNYLWHGRYTMLPIFVDETMEPGRFQDSAQVSGWAQKAVGWAANASVLLGVKTDGAPAVEPRRAITKKEAALLLTRFAGILQWPGEGNADGTEKDTLLVYGTYGDGALYALTKEDTAALQALLEDESWEDYAFVEHVPTYVITLGEKEYLFCMEDGKLLPFYSFSSLSGYGGKKAQDPAVIERIAKICEKYFPGL